MLSLDETIEAVSQRLLALDPGPLAELRRMEPDGVGTPIFWRLAAELDFRADQTKQWMQVVRILAILTPKSRLNPAVRLHDGSSGLAALFVTVAIRRGHRTPKILVPRSQKHVSRACLPPLSRSAEKLLLGLPVCWLGPALRKLASTALILRVCSCKLTIRSRPKI